MMCEKETENNGKKIAEEVARFYRERHTEAIELAKRFGLPEVAVLIEEGWDEQEGRCHGPGSTLEYLLYTGKHKNYQSISDFEKFLTGVGEESERAFSWFDFNGFVCESRRYNGFSQFLEKYIKATVDKQGEGWRDIQFLMPWIVGMRFSRKMFSVTGEEAIAKDLWSALNILVDVGAMKLTKPVVRDILRADNKGEIAEQLILKDREFSKFFTPREALLHLCAACPNDEKCVRLVKLLLKSDPDIVRPDINGYTPLVYMFFAHRCPQMCYRSRATMERRRGLEKLLIDHGCDPDHRDRFGISWSMLDEVAKDYIPCW